MSSRSAWLRALTFYEAAVPSPAPADGHRGGPVFCPDHAVHRRSRFRSLDLPERFALYSVVDRDVVRDGADPVSGPWGQHTLSVVREFRRVPLEASALGLVLFVARPGRTASMIATLADFAQRALGLYRPAYLLLAYSVEMPRLSILVMAVHEVAALEAASPGAFGLDPVLPELDPLLDTAPQWYTYCPGPEAAV